MNNSPFYAKNWLKNEAQTVTTPVVNRDVFTTTSTNNFCPSELFPNFTPAFKTSIPSGLEFNPASFLTPGWTGESLKSKTYLRFENLFEKICDDVKNQFLSNQFNRTLQIQIYQEFVSFLAEQSLNFHAIDGHQKFWNEVKLEKSEYDQTLAHFIHAYAQRVAIIYFLKLRFISKIALENNQKLETKNFFNPTSLITSIFKKGGSTELRSKALETNIYSWYRPEHHLADELAKLSEISTEITISEIIKKTSEQSQQFKNENHYSHTLSHRNFGLFLNSLIINYPTWLHCANHHQLPTAVNGAQCGLEIISTKYTGDYLECIANSHWLAQNNNKEIKWKQIICPDFKGNDFSTGLYLKLFNELQFITFLVDVAKIQQHPLISFLSNVSKDSLINRKTKNQVQPSFLEDTQDTQSSYDRVVLNISNTPKNNPYFHIYHQINTESESLKDGGKMIVMSNKNLFIPSQKEKIDQLLQTLNFEGMFELEDVKGKGEVPNYIFIFSKKNHSSSNNIGLCFRINAELSTFQKFSTITDELQSFYRKNLFNVPVIYRKDFANNFSLEFYQDAVIDGRLVHSSNKDQNKITHPSFFKNLLNSTFSLDLFFNIYPVETLDAYMGNGALDIGELAPHTPKFPYLLLIDGRSNKIKLEISSATTLQAKIQECGITQCEYFGLRPKIPNLNINLLREFFQSQLGHEIIELTFMGQMKKAKAKISSLLVPKLLAQHKEAPVHVTEAFKYFSVPANEINNDSAKNICQHLTASQILLMTIYKNYPNAVLSVLAYLKHNTQEALSKSSLDTNDLHNIFASQEFRNSLPKLKLKPLLEQNEQIFIDFCQKDKSMLDRNLTMIKTSEHVIQGQVLNGLEFFSGEECVVKIFGPNLLMKFLNYLLQFVMNKPVSYILKSLLVPEHSALSQQLNLVKNSRNELIKLHDKVSQLFSQLLNQSISLD
ncbi:MAG: hypothetical protein JNM93_13210 [Bacteriovoracaceae bacterium]|nr:hypothetical protein [Bacteriovoracaceae bacterium]